LLAQLREVADYVVIDTPPILLAGDAFPLVQLADTTLVVCREGTTSREDARAVSDALSKLGVRQFSVVLTESEAAERRAYGYGYGYTDRAS
jgi:Mrp family chromosome partitioning ATPase